MKILLIFAALLTLSACSANVDLDCDAAETQSLSLDEHTLAVVAEGEGEPRSMGSYSLRLYRLQAGNNDRDFFIAGTVAARDGFLKKLLLADVIGKGQPALVVVFESAGSGSYISARAWQYSAKNLHLLASVDGLAPEQDILASLRQHWQSQQP